MELLLEPGANGRVVLVGRDGRVGVSFSNGLCRCCSIMDCRKRLTDSVRRVEATADLTGEWGRSDLGLAGCTRKFVNGPRSELQKATNLQRHSQDVVPVLPDPEFRGVFPRPEIEEAYDAASSAHERLAVARQRHSTPAYFDPHLCSRHQLQKLSVQKPNDPLLVACDEQQTGSPLKGDVRNRRWQGAAAEGDGSERGRRFGRAEEVNDTRCCPCCEERASRGAELEGGVGRF